MAAGWEKSRQAIEKRLQEIEEAGGEIKEMFYVHHTSQIWIRYLEKK